MQNTPELTAEALELTEQYVRKVMEYQKADSGQSDERIARYLLQEDQEQ